ncbi:BTB/POZ domain [Trinorchestia longiramus]|nr:BTB/POZ domain [Trinorchestia longiramus]
METTDCRDHATRSHLENLPPEILVHIFSYLNVFDMENLRLTSSTLSYIQPRFLNFGCFDERFISDYIALAEKRGESVKKIHCLYATPVFLTSVVCKLHNLTELRLSKPMFLFIQTLEIVAEACVHLKCLKLGSAREIVPFLLTFSDTFVRRPSPLRTFNNLKELELHCFNDWPAAYTSDVFQMCCRVVNLQMTVARAINGLLSLPIHWMTVVTHVTLVTDLQLHPLTEKLLFKKCLKVEINMDEGLLSLKWNNHRGTFLHILTALRDKPLHSDVTLACGGSLYPVHKLVLSACSSYFESIFASITCPQPVVVLKDIRSEDLEALLDYMYAGEVEVKHSSLSSLIKAAECLCIKGLAVPDGDPSHSSTPNKARVAESGLEAGSIKRRKLDTSGLGDVQDRRKANQNNHNSVTSPLHSSRFDASVSKASETHGETTQNNSSANQRNNGEVSLQRSRHKRRLSDDRSLTSISHGESSFLQTSGDDVSDASCDNQNWELKNDVSPEKNVTEPVVKVELEEEEESQTPEDLLIEKTEATEYEENEESSVSGVSSYVK